MIAAKKEYGIIDDVISIEYVPKTGKNRGNNMSSFIKVISVDYLRGYEILVRK